MREARSLGVVRRLLGIAVLVLGVGALAWAVPQVLRAGEEEFFCDEIVGESGGIERFETGIRWVPVETAVHVVAIAGAALTAVGLVVLGRRPPVA